MNSSITQRGLGSQKIPLTGMLSLAARLLVGLALVASAGNLLAANRTGASTGWRILGGGSDAQFYSPLALINDKNVGKLGLAWAAEIPSQDGLAGNPLVADGVVYQSGPRGRIYANDIRTGKSLWTFSPEISFTRRTSFASLWSSRYNRGLALLGNLVFVASGDCRLFAVDRKTGKEVWQAAPCDRTKMYGITQAPRVGDGKVFIGNNCGESGATRGHVDAFDAKTGRHVWRFYTMPGDPAKPFESKILANVAKTWGHDYWKYTHGCDSPWEGMTYDDELNLLYFGTASPTPWNPKERAKNAGDELFSDSIIAVDASTGKYVWSFQTVPHDGWDFEATMPIMIADLPIHGKRRRVVMTAPKNGFFYVLDARTGQFISGKNYQPVNWTSGLNPVTGRPEILPEARYWEHPDRKFIINPGPDGAHNVQPMAFNPATGLVYFPSLYDPTLLEPDPSSTIGGALMDLYYGLQGHPRWKPRGDLIAWDPVRQKAAWRFEHTMPINGGVLSTAGNLVFEGTAEGELEAFAADTGKLLWSFDAHGAIVAAPATVEVDGKQVILAASGNAGALPQSVMSKFATTPQSRSVSRLLAFELGGRGVIPPTVVPEFPRPPLPRQPAALAKKGSVQFEARSCSECHGFDAESTDSSVPDLRRLPAQVYDMLPDIVIRGLYLPAGMPSFPDMSPDELKAIKAYIINQSWAAYDEQQARKTNTTAH